MAQDSGTPKDTEKTDPNLAAPEVEEITLSEIVLPQKSPPPANPLPPRKMPEFGPLEVFMKDPKVSEVMVNDIRNVMIEKEGKMQFSGFAYPSIDELNRL